jgi:acetyl esterase/lipase
MVAYRPSTVAKAPAQLHDLKAALNHLQTEHARWNLAADKVVLWGTSSGAHLVSLAGLTAEGGPDIAGVVNFFGPTDFRRMGDFPSVMDHNAPNSPESLVVGGPIQDPEFGDAVAAYNPLTYVDADKPTPPFLLMHGDRDPLVPFNQSVLLYEALRDAGHDVTFYKLKDAGHGTRFFTPKPLAIVEAFMARVLGN